MGKKTETTTSESKPWAPAIPHLENILNNAGQLFDKNGGINGNWIDKELADLNPEMQETVKNMINSQGFKDLASNIGNATQQGMSGIGQATGALGGLTQQGVTSEDLNKMASELYDTEMVQTQKEQLGKDVQAGLDKNVQRINQGASGSGSMGSSRAGVAEGVAIGEASDAVAQGGAAIENAARQSAYGQAMGTLQGNQQTALGAAGQLGQLGLGSANAQAGLGGMYQQMLQNQMTGSGILQNQQQNQLNNQWFNQQGQANAGWDNLNKYLGMTGAIGGMGGTQTNTSGGGGGGMSSLGALAGGVAGGFFGGPTGAMAGASVGGSLFGNSDASLKKKVKATGKKTKKGHKEYTWEWNESAEKKLGKKGSDKGVLAQEVLKKDPSAIAKNKKTGTLMVDYNKV